MHPGRVLAAIAAVLTLLPIQHAVIARIPLPGTGPDVLIVLVVAVALLRGPAVGAVMGFCTGLAADLAPPADHTMGRLALCYCVAGYLAGLLADEAERSALAPMAVVAIIAVFVIGTYAALGALLGDARVTAATLARTLPSSVLYDVVLTPFLVPLVAAVVRRLEPDSSRSVVRGAGPGVRL
ncbi:MAG: rod shape-determining protein MreD [Actinomycetes bacterium]